MKQKIVYNRKEAAAYLGISVSTLYRMEKKGVISSHTESGEYTGFTQKSLESILKNKSHKVKEPETAYTESTFSIEKTGEKTPPAGLPTAQSLAPTLFPHRVEITHPSYIEPYFQEDSIEIYNADILTMNSIRDNSIDLIVTSPPYNVDIQYNSHNDNLSYSDYLLFTRNWLAKCYCLAKEDGRFCLNIPLDKNKGGHQSVCADITTIAKQVGWKYHSTIIWNEQNISRRTAWGSWLSASAPYVIAPVEVILVLYKTFWKKTSGSRKSDITKEEFMQWTNGVWTFMGESKKRIGHPTPFPVELPKRCMKLFSFVGDTVLDPFLGSGTTLLACSLNGRKGIGVEIDINYCRLARQRLIKEAQVNQLKIEGINVRQ